MNDVYYLLLVTVNAHEWCLLFTVGDSKRSWMMFIGWEDINCELDSSDQQVQEDYIEVSRNIL